MSLFKKNNSFWRNAFDNPFDFEDNHTIIEKVEMLFTDVETEGKKQGYDRASKEYATAYRKIEKEFYETKKLIEQQKTSYDNKAEVLIKKLESLEQEKERLEKEVSSKTRDVSRTYNIPISDVTNSLTSGIIEYNISSLEGVDILGIIYKHKEKKLKDAEQRGYAEAKELYEKKISKLKNELKKLQENGESDIKKLLAMIDEIFQAIVQEQTKIAELKILL